MRQSLTESIGKYRYTITQLGATQGRRVYRRLLSLVGSAAESLETSNEGAALKMIGKLVANLSDEDLDFFCDTFAPVTSVSGGEFGNKNPQLDAIFEEHFSGRMIEMTKWLLACFKCNFSDLFQVLGSGAAEASVVAEAPKDGSPLSSQKSLIGRFGVSSQAPESPSH